MSTLLDIVQLIESEFLFNQRSGGSKLRPDAATEAVGRAVLMQRNDQDLVLKPELPQHGHSYSLMFRFDVEHVNVQTITRWVNAVIHIANSLIDDLDAVDDVGTREYEIARMRFARLTQQRCTLDEAPS